MCLGKKCSKMNQKNKLDSNSRVFRNKQRRERKFQILMKTLEFASSIVDILSKLIH